MKDQIAVELVDEIRGDLLYFHFDEVGYKFESIWSIVSIMENPGGILAFVKRLKDDGNALYKKDSFSSAMEKYEVALMCLAFLCLDCPEDRISFHDLALSLTLNLAACSLKLKDYWKTGQLCCMVLKYDSTNVKAFFRRALAALELNKPDLAHTDLVKAAEIEPSNHEVLKKLEFVEGMMGSQIGKRKNGSQVDSHPTQKYKISHTKSETVRRSRELVLGKDYVVCDVSSSSRGSESNTGEFTQSFHQGREITKISSNEKSDLTEPKLRFYNRRKQGSLNISRSTYESLLQGKTLSFYHPYLSMGMTVCARKCQEKAPEEDIKAPCPMQEEEPSSPNNSCTLKTLDLNMAQDGKEEGSYISNQDCVSMALSPVSCFGESDGLCASPNQHILFEFGSNSKPAPGRSKSIKHKALVKLTNRSFILRVRVGTKRRCQMKSRDDWPIMSFGLKKRRRVDSLHPREAVEGDRKDEVVSMVMAMDGRQARTHWTMVGILPDVSSNLNFTAHGLALETRK